MKLDRSENKGAYFLAKLARSEHQPVLWLQDAPEELQSPLALDCKPIY